MDAGVGVKLLRNDSHTGHWIAFRLTGRASPRDGYGARLTLKARRAGSSFVRVAGCRGTRSYLSSCDPRVRFGLGRGDVTVEQVEIRWPTGILQTLDAPRIDRVHEVTEPGS